MKFCTHTDFGDLRPLAGKFHLANVVTCLRSVPYSRGDSISREHENIVQAHLESYVHVCLCTEAVQQLAWGILKTCLTNSADFCGFVCNRSSAWI